MYLIAHASVHALTGSSPQTFTVQPLFTTLSQILLSWFEVCLIGVTVCTCACGTLTDLVFLEPVKHTL